MQWGGAAPAAHSGGGPLGGGAAEQSARFVEPVEVRVHVVHGLNGETIAVVDVGLNDLPKASVVCSPTKLQTRRLRQNV